MFAASESTDVLSTDVATARRSSSPPKTIPLPLVETLPAAEFSTMVVPLSPVIWSEIVILPPAETLMFPPASTTMPAATTSRSSNSLMVTFPPPPAKAAISATEVLTRTLPGLPYAAASRSVPRT